MISFSMGVSGPAINTGRRRRLNTIAGLLATLLLAGCSSSPDTSSTSKSSSPAPTPTTALHVAAKKPRVALVMKSLANEFFKTMEDGARAHQSQHSSNYDLLTNGIKDEQDVAKQIDLVGQMVAQKVDAIVLAPADSHALVPACKKATDAGIVVVNIDNRLDAGALADKKLKVPFVGPDNRKGARLAGDYLAHTLKAGDEVAIIEGAPNAFNGEQRRLGFEDAMKAAGMKIVSSQTGKWETNEANKVAGALLPRYPDLKAFLCANDSMALGAVAALRAVGKAGKVKVIGFDNIATVQQLIREGQVLCTVDQHGDKIAVYGIQYALDILQHKAPAADKETPVDLITAKELAAGPAPAKH